MARGPGSARWQAAKGAGDIVLEEMWDAGREGLAQTIEEVRPCRSRRHGSQRQHGDRTSEAQKPTNPGNQCRYSRVTRRDLDQTAELPDVRWLIRRVPNCGHHNPNGTGAETEKTRTA
jgi:hypothetical protein